MSLLWMEPFPRQGIVNCIREGNEGRVVDIQTFKPALLMTDYERE